jgi:hypothetical protein
MTAVLAIGTGRGPFLARSDGDRRTWTLSGPRFPMTAVWAGGIDRRRATARQVASADRTVAGGLAIPVPDRADVRILPSVPDD